MKKTRTLSTEKVSKGEITPFAPNYKLIMEMSTRERKRKEIKLKAKRRNV
jgi:hypothetical protein